MVKVGIVALSEAGNYGDDLILLAVVQALEETFVEVDVRYLSFGQPLAWNEIVTALSLRSRPLAVRPDRDLPGTRRGSIIYRNMDAIIFGGGGLLQTSHHPDRPYHWLRYLPSTLKVPVLAVGLGVGPLDTVWLRKLQELGQPFTECFVRDEMSRSLANDLLGWDARLCADFVDEKFLEQLLPSAGSRDKRGVLGVALRAWPGIGAKEMAAHIMSVATASSVEVVRFFVLEANNGQGEDVSLTREVMDHLAGIDAEMHVYSSDELLGFTELMADCALAISMKLHSSAVWGSLGIPIYPIIYAPKVAAFFGLEYRGTEVLDRVVRPSKQSEAWPRASAVIKSELPSLVSQPQRERSLLSYVFRTRHQISSFRRNLVKKFASVRSSVGN